MTKNRKTLCQDPGGIIGSWTSSTGLSHSQSVDNLPLDLQSLSGKHRCARRRKEHQSSRRQTNSLTTYSKPIGSSSAQHVQVPAAVALACLDDTFRCGFAIDISATCSFYYLSIAGTLLLRLGMVYQACEQLSPSIDLADGSRLVMYPLNTWATTPTSASMMWKGTYSCSYWSTRIPCRSSPYQYEKVVQRKRLDFHHPDKVPGKGMEEIWVSDAGSLFIVQGQKKWRLRVSSLASDIGATSRVIANHFKQILLRKSEMLEELLSCRLDKQV